MWRTFTIDAGRTGSVDIYAPSLDSAFDLARRLYGNKPLTCRGSRSGR
jgi:hypothetical protein